MSQTEHPAAPPTLPLLRRMRPGLRVVLLWLVSRTVMCGLFATPLENVIQGDPFYYHRKVGELSTIGLPGVMMEYPVPAVWVLQLPYLLGGGNALGYVILFVAGMALLDAAFTWLLWHSAGRRSSAAVDFWLVFVPAVGPLVWFRFDLLPAVLVGGALLFSVARPRLAGVLAAAGAATKLWPALVWPALFCRPGRGRWWTTLAFAATGIALAGISLAIGGWQRLVSPLTWQSDRGLQIESIAATPLMVARMVQPDRWRVELSKFNAYEIVTGPGISTSLTVASLATGAGLLVIVCLTGLLLVQLQLRATRAGSDPAGSADTQTSETAWRIGVLVLAIVMVLIVTNKTFSPQYVVWLGGPMAYLLLHCSGSGPRTRTTTALMWSVVALGVLTQLVYPVLYPPLYGDPGPLVPATIVLAARNALACGLAAWTIVLAVRPPRPRSEPVPR